MYRLFLLYLFMDNLLELYKSLTCFDTKEQRSIHSALYLCLKIHYNIEVDPCFCACKGNKQRALKILKAFGKI